MAAALLFDERVVIINQIVCCCVGVYIGEYSQDKFTPIRFLHSLFRFPEGREEHDGLGGELLFKSLVNGQYKQYPRVRILYGKGVLEIDVWGETGTKKSHLGWSTNPGIYGYFGDNRTLSREKAHLEALIKYVV